MPKVPRAVRQAVFLALALAAAAFFQLRSQAPGFTYLAHENRVEPGAMLISALIIYAIIAGAWALTSELAGKAYRIPYKEALAADFWTYLPVAGFAFAPLALARYLTWDDLARRLDLLLAGIVFAILYLKAVLAARTLAAARPPWLERIRHFHGLPIRRKMVLLFLAAILAYNLGSIAILAKGITFSGDEPHYLMITHSLLHDGDFDLANNYAAQDYARYMPEQVTIRSHALAGKKPGSQYSFHSPGVSILLLPFYALGSLLGRTGLVLFIRLGMSLVGALFGIQIFLFARREWGREGLALALWALASFTSPVFFYAIHVYPELIVSLCVFTAFRLFRHGAPLSRSRLLLCGLLMSSFIWFHALKYFFILGPLFLYALWAILKKHKDRRDVAWFLALPILNFALYFVFQYALYGSLNPTAVSWQGAMDKEQTVSFLNQLLTGIPFRFRIETLAGYFLDQRDGLLLYAPIYFFAFLGLVEAFRARARRSGALLLLFIMGPYILVSAFLTQRTGYAPQARPLVSVIWGLVIFIGYFLASDPGKFFRYLFNFAAGMGLAFVGLLLANPYALYQETTVGATERGGLLFYGLSNLHVSLPNVLPSFIKSAPPGWPPNVVWPVLILVFMAAYVLFRRRGFALTFAHHLALAGAGLAVFFLMFVASPRITLVPMEKTVLPSGETMAFYALSRVARLTEPGTFALLESDRDYHFYFATKKPAPRLAVRYGALQGDYGLKLGFFDAAGFDGTTSGEILTKDLEAPAPYRWKGLSLYRITVRLDRKSDAKTGVNPYVLGFRPKR
jgi:hypothetical protein